MDDMYTVPAISEDALHDEIRKQYANVAIEPGKGYHFHTGRAAADRIGYDQALYVSVPEANIASFAGTGNPFALGPVKPGDVVVDVGSGAGFDALIASRMVGLSGRVIGVDMTPEMLDRARDGARAMGADNVEFRQGLADRLPLDNGVADILISNGVLNLSPDKNTTLGEWARVLKSGGRLYVGDILVSKKVPRGALDDISLWTGWIAGGLLEADLLQVVTASGFEDAEIAGRHPIFQDVPDPSSALAFGTIGISLRARKTA